MAINNENVAFEFEKYEQKLSKAIEFFKSELGAIRAGRANPAILSKITIDYYGTPTLLTQMANISIPEARLMTISLYDISMLKEVNRAILASDIGITPTDDGKIIRLVFPQLTKERRVELSKQVKKICEESKVVLRNERRDVLEILKKLKKDNLITEDEQTLYDKDVQKLLDKNIEILDRLLKEKEAEILEV